MSLPSFMSSTKIHLKLSLLYQPSKGYLVGNKFVKKNIFVDFYINIMHEYQASHNNNAYKHSNSGQSCQIKCNISQAQAFNNKTNGYNTDSQHQSQAYNKYNQNNRYKKSQKTYSSQNSRQNPYVCHTLTKQSKRQKCTLSFEVRCKICTNSLVYVKNINSPNNMFLLKHFYQQHDHRLDQQKFSRNSDQMVRFDYRANRQRLLRLDLNHYGNSIQQIQKCIRELPISLTHPMRQKIICRKFNLTANQFKNIYLKLSSKKQIQFAEFIQDLNRQNFEYRYLPENLLSQNSKVSRKYNQNSKKNLVTPQNLNFNKNDLTSIQSNMAQPYIWIDNSKLGPQTPTIGFPNNINPSNGLSSQRVYSCNSYTQNSPQYKIDPNSKDPKNPDLPNVMLIVSPRMKKQYQKYGQYVGFDLTFSLIKEQPTHNKEYLVGIFASKNLNFRIVIFGLVITNNQSSQVYKWLFKNFMQIMGKHPETIISDEEIAIGRAVRQLRQQGYYKGYHLLDTFHVLTKFRKAVQSETFQLMRKLIHAKDKYEYKKLFQETINQLTNDDELKVLRDFDHHSQKYCYSHIPPTFVGFGVSDAMNESFHNILKDKIPYQIKYLKACNIMLNFIQQRNKISQQSIICEIPYEQKLQFPWLKPYRQIVGDRIFNYLITQCAKGITYSVVFKNQAYTKDQYQKIQQCSYNDTYLRNQPMMDNVQGGFNLIKAMEKNKFQIVTPNGICLVWKQKIPDEFLNYKFNEYGQRKNFHKYWAKYSLDSTYTNNHYPYSKDEPKLINQTFKWRCICQYEQKAGLCCSHILKILVLKNQYLLPYIHPRWLIMEDNILDGQQISLRKLQKFKHNVHKTTEISSNRHKSIRLRGKYVLVRNTLKQEIIQQQKQQLKGGLPYSSLKTPQYYNKRGAKINVQREYIEWIQQNDKGIKQSKEKIQKILQKKQKKVKKLQQKQKYKNNRKQNYVQYQYLSTTHMKKLQKQRKMANISKKIQQQGEIQDVKNKYYMRNMPAYDYIQGHAMQDSIANIQGDIDLNQQDHCYQQQNDQQDIVCFDQEIKYEEYHRPYQQEIQYLLQNSQEILQQDSEIVDDKMNIYGQKINQKPKKTCGRSPKQPNIPKNIASKYEVEEGKFKRTIPQKRYKLKKPAKHLQQKKQVYMWNCSSYQQDYQI